MRGDDAVGLEVARHWQETYTKTARLDNVRVEFAENPGPDLLNLMTGADYAILVDAIHSGAEPGALNFFRENDVVSFLDEPGSVHDWGVAETLALGRQLNLEKLPTQIDLICIEAGQFDMVNKLSPDVAAAVPKAAVLVQKKLRELIYCPT